MQDNWQNILDKLDYAFQPIVHIHTGKIYAVEALLRNVIGQNGFNSINDIFNLAFNDDYLYDLDIFLKELAIKKYSQIDNNNLKLFYNLDNRIIYNNYKNDDNYKTLKNIMKTHNIKKNDVCFELSEKGTSIEQSAMSSMIQQYKSIGYNIAIDDFGIGVSGLKLLYFSEANIIKLDRYFVSNIDKDQKKKLFCSSIIEMAHIMGMRVIAEGVERAKEFYTCREIGADFIQGYLVQKPTLKTNEIKKQYQVITDLIENDKRNSNTLNFDEDYVEKIKPLKESSTLYELFVHFKEETKNNFVPIVDSNNLFLGIIYEPDIKKISYSQYGLSLAQNKTYSSSLKKYIKTALSVETSWGIDKILEIYHMNASNDFGIFVTNAGKYLGFINLNSLLTLSYKRNIEIATNQNPLTKLPGNNQIEKFINKSLKKQKNKKTQIIYFDFNNFKPFNDIYGFRLGDRAILIFAELLQKRYSKNSFIAHIGGDDFFVGIKDSEFEKVYELTLEIQKEFSNTAKNLYSNEDKQNGYLLAKDRYNVDRKFDLLGVSAAILEINHKSDITNFDNIIGELKKASKSSNSPICASI